MGVEYEKVQQETIDEMKSRHLSVQEGRDKADKEDEESAIQTLLQELVSRVTDIESRAATTTPRPIARMSGSEDLAGTIKKINELVDFINILIPNNRA